MSKKKMIFYRANPDRKKEHSLRTFIYKEGDRYRVEKIAASEAAQDHLENMARTYSKLSKESTFSKIITPVSIQLSDGVAVFDYIHGKSAEHELLQAIVNQQEKSATEIIDTLISAIDALGGSTVNAAKNDDFVAVFGNVYNKPLPCTELGFIDLNLDNVVIDSKNTWHLIDYEWSYDFPVPKMLLIQRFLFWFFCDRYPEILLRHAEKLSLLKIGDNCYVPSYLYDRYSKYFSGLSEVVRAETSFQNINGSGLENYDLYEKPEKVTQHEARGANKLIQDMNELDRMNEELQHKMDALRDELTTIKSSKRYKISNKVADAINKVTFRS